MFREIGVHATVPGYTTHARIDDTPPWPWSIPDQLLPCCGKRLSVYSPDGRFLATPARWHWSMRYQGGRCNYPFRCDARNRCCAENAAIRRSCLVYIMTYELVYQGPPLIQADELVSFRQSTLTRSKARHSLPAQSNLCEYNKVLWTHVARRREHASFGSAQQVQHAAHEQQILRRLPRAASVAAACLLVGPPHHVLKSHNHALIPATSTCGAREP